MNEILFETVDHDIAAFNGKTIFFAFGEDPFLYWILFWVAGFFILILLGNFLQSLLRKKEMLSGKCQSYLPYLVVFLMLVGAFVFMQKQFIEPLVTIPITQRRNLITIDLPEKKVTVKENNTIVESFIFSPDDYFYLMTLNGNKSTSYSLLLIHNGTQKEVIYSNHFGDVQAIQTVLLEQGFPVQISQ